MIFSDNTHSAEDCKLELLICKKTVSQSMAGKIVIPMITPHRKNSLDIEALKSLMEYAGSKGFDGLFAASSTGGCASFSYGQHFRVLRAVFNGAPGVKLFANVSRNDLEESLEMLKDAEELGYDNFVCINPYYHKYSESSMYRYFSSIAEATSGKVYIYNNPALTGNTVTPELMEKLRAQYSNVAGIKDSGGDLKAFQKFVEIEGLEVYQGKDHLLQESLAMGAYGGVCSTSNFSLNTLHVAHMEGDASGYTDKISKVTEVMKKCEVPAFHNYMFRLFVLREQNPVDYMNWPFADLVNPPAYDEVSSIV